MSACPIPVERLSPGAKRAVTAPPPARMMAARGLAPMPPKDLVTTQFVLTFDADAKIAETARGSLSNLDPRIANAVLPDTSLDPHVLGFLAEVLVARDADVERILLNPTSPDTAFMFAAEHGSEATCEVVANNQARVLRAPEIARHLTRNPKVLKSTIDRVIDFLVRNNIILDGVAEFDTALMRLSGAERVAAADLVEIPEEFLDSAYLGEDEDEAHRQLISDEDELAGDEEDDGKKQTIEQILRDMTTGQKVAFATKGNRSVRAILVRDSNRVVAIAAISAPTVTESEAVASAQSRTVHQDVIAYISRNKDWMRNYQIKLAIAGNPKTPLPTAMKLIPTLMKKDLKQLGMSKNVPMGVRNLALRLSKQSSG